MRGIPGPSDDDLEILLGDFFTGLWEPEEEWF